MHCSVQSYETFVHKTDSVKNGCQESYEPQHYRLGLILDSSTVTSVSQFVKSVILVIHQF